MPIAYLPGIISVTFEESYHYINTLNSVGPGVRIPPWSDLEFIRKNKKMTPAAVNNCRELPFSRG